MSGPEITDWADAAQRLIGDMAAFHAAEHLGTEGPPTRAELEALARHKLGSDGVDRALKKLLVARQSAIGGELAGIREQLLSEPPETQGDLLVRLSRAVAAASEACHMCAAGLWSGPDAGKVMSDASKQIDICRASVGRFVGDAYGGDLADAVSNAEDALSSLEMAIYETKILRGDPRDDK